MIQVHPLRAPSNDIPDDVLGNPLTPWHAVTADVPENPARCDHGGKHPAIDSGLDKAALAQSEGDRPCQPGLRLPISLSHL